MFPVCWKHPRGRNPNTQHRPGAQGCPQPPTLKGRGELMSLERKNVALCGRDDDSSTIFSLFCIHWVHWDRGAPSHSSLSCWDGGRSRGWASHSKPLSVPEESSSDGKNLQDMEKSSFLAGESPGLCTPSPAGFGDSEDVETSKGDESSSCSLQAPDPMGIQALQTLPQWEFELGMSGAEVWAGFCLVKPWRGKAEWL